MPAPVFPPGPRLNALYAVGSALVDLSSADVSWDPDAVPSPISVVCEGGGTLKYDTYDGRTDTRTVSAGETVNVAVTKIYKTGTTATGIHVYF